MTRPYLADEDWSFKATCSSCPTWGRKIMTYDAVMGHALNNHGHHITVVTTGREVYVATDLDHPPVPKGQHGPELRA